MAWSMPRIVLPRRPLAGHRRDLPHSLTGTTTSLPSSRSHSIKSPFPMPIAWARTRGNVMVSCPVGCCWTRTLLDIGHGTYHSYYYINNSMVGVGESVHWLEGLGRSGTGRVTRPDMNDPVLRAARRGGDGTCVRSLSFYLSSTSNRRDAIMLMLKVSRRNCTKNNIKGGLSLVAVPSHRVRPIQDWTFEGSLP